MRMHASACCRWKTRNPVIRLALPRWICQPQPQLTPTGKRAASTRSAEVRGARLSSVSAWRPHLICQLNSSQPASFHWSPWYISTTIGQFWGMFLSRSRSAGLQTGGNTLQLASLCSGTCFRNALGVSLPNMVSLLNICGWCQERSKLRTRQWRPISP